jgi:hypothetical protein
MAADNITAADRSAGLLPAATTPEGGANLGQSDSSETKTTRSETYIGRSRVAEAQPVDLTWDDVLSGGVSAGAPMAAPPLPLGAVGVTLDCLRVHLWLIVGGTCIGCFSALAFLLAASGIRVLLHPYIATVLLLAGAATVRIAWLSLALLHRSDTNR